GRYRVASLTVGILNAGGDLWEYWFDGNGPCDFQVESGRRSEHVLLPDLKLTVNVARRSSGTPLSANPRYGTAGLELTNCTVRPKRGARPESRSARISVVTARGMSSATALSGFA